MKKIGHVIRDFVGLPKLITVLVLLALALSSIDVLGYSNGILGYTTLTLIVTAMVVACVRFYITLKDSENKRITYLTYLRRKKLIKALDHIIFQKKKVQP